MLMKPPQLQFYHRSCHRDESHYLRRPGLLPIEMDHVDHRIPTPTLGLRHLPLPSAVLAAQGHLSLCFQRAGTIATTVNRPVVCSWLSRYHL